MVVPSSSEDLPADNVFSFPNVMLHSSRIGKVKCFGALILFFFRTRTSSPTGGYPKEVWSKADMKTDSTPDFSTGELLQPTANFSFASPCNAPVLFPPARQHAKSCQVAHTSCKTIHVPHLKRHNRNRSRCVQPACTSSHYIISKHLSPAHSGHISHLQHT